jgi:hypothetical protein
MAPPLPYSEMWYGPLAPPPQHPYQQQMYQAQHAPLYGPVYSDFAHTSRDIVGQRQPVRAPQHEWASDDYSDDWQDAPQVLLTVHSTCTLYSSRCCATTYLLTEHALQCVRNHSHSAQQQQHLSGTVSSGCKHECAA